MKEPRMLCALRMAAIVVAASGVLTTLGSSSPQAPATAPASPSLVVTPPAGTVVRRDEQVSFRLSVQGGANVSHDFVLTRVPDLVVGRVARGTGTVTIPFRVPPDAAPGRMDFRATATSVAPARQLGASTHVIVASVAGGGRSPSPSPSAGTSRQRWEGTQEGETKVIYCQPTRTSGTVVLDVAEDGTVTGELDATGTPYNCSPPQGPYSVTPPRHKTRITGTKTATAFTLQFAGGTRENLVVSGREARGTFQMQSGGTTARSTIVVRCTQGCARQ